MLARHGKLFGSQSKLLGPKLANTIKYAKIFSNSRELIHPNNGTNWLTKEKMRHVKPFLLQLL